MPTFTLTDLCATSGSTPSADPGRPRPGLAPAWSVTKRTLRGGRRDGVDLIEVDNGALSFAIVPTRGMGLWKGSLPGRSRWAGTRRSATGRSTRRSSTSMDRGGLGWLDGFDELLVRCGLESNGAPFEVEDRSPTARRATP